MYVVFKYQLPFKMADKMSDAEIRKELIALGEKSIGPITDTTRPLYLKKLTRLKSENKSKSFKSRGRNKQLVTLSSDESDEDDIPETSVRSKSANKSRSLRSNTSLNLTNSSRKPSNTNKPVGTGKESVVTRRHVVKTSTVRSKNIERDETDNGDPHNSTMWDDEPLTRSAIMQTSFNSTLNRTRGFEDSIRLHDKDFGNEFSDSDREDVKPSVVSQSVNTSARLNDSSRWTPRFGNWRSRPLYKSTVQSSSRTNTYSPRLHSSFSDQTGVMGTDGFKAKDSSSSYTFSQFISAFLVVMAILFFGFLTFMYLSMQRAEDAREQGN